MFKGKKIIKDRLTRNHLTLKGIFFCFIHTSITKKNIISKIFAIKKKLKRKGFI